MLDKICLLDEYGAQVIHDVAEDLQMVIWVIFYLGAL